MTENKDKFHASCFQERLQKLIEVKTKENNKFSQKQLSAETGIAEGSISKYLRGDAEPKMLTLTRLADYFDVSVDYLVGISDCKKYDASMQAASKFTGLTDEALSFFSSAKEDEVMLLSCILENELWKNVLSSYRSYAYTVFRPLYTKTLASKVENELGEWKSQLTQLAKNHLIKYIPLCDYNQIKPDKNYQMSILFALTQETMELAKVTSEIFAERKLRTKDMNQIVKHMKERIDSIDNKERHRRCVLE